MFNDYSWGGYIIYKTYPERKVFIDNRNQLYEKSIFKKFTSTVYLTEDWEKLDREYSFDHVIIRKEYPIAELLNLSPRWRLVYSDKIASIFVKQWTYFITTIVITFSIKKKICVSKIYITINQLWNYTTSILDLVKEFLIQSQIRICFQ